MTTSEPASRPKTRLSLVMVYSRPSVRQTRRPPVGAGRRRGGRSAGGRQIGEGAGVEELGVARPPGVDREDLVGADLDLVAVQDRGGVGAEPHAVDQKLRIGLARADGGGPLRGALQDGVPRPHPLAFEDNRAARR